ncbi:hypothetical protein CPB85DRAFT_1441242 [Mucidula mucida]|nr:hypothetical protein CPB85DRAFT_1441242 [Mucidula mucida]
MSAPGPLPPPVLFLPFLTTSSPGTPFYIGLQLLGSLLNFMLYGILALQIYIYHTSFPRTIGRLNGWRLAEPGIIPIYTPIMGSVIAFMVQFLDHQAVRVVAVGYYRYGNARFRYASLHVAEHGVCLQISVVQAASGFVGGVRAILLVKDIQAGLAHNQTLLVYVKPLGTLVIDAHLIRISYI